MSPVKIPLVSRGGKNLRLFLTRDQDSLQEEAVFEFYLDWAEFQFSYSLCLLGVWRVECQVEN